MKKVVIIFGFPKNIVEKRLKFYTQFSNKFKTKVIKINDLNFKSKIDNIKIDFLYAFCPKRDSAYLDSKKYIKKNYREKVPLPAKEVCKKIKNADFVLFFGICGGLKQKIKIGDIFLPNTFYELNIKGIQVSEKEAKTLIPKNKIIYQNELIGKLKGRRAECLTINLSTWEGNFKNPEMKPMFEKRLAKKIDIVEKETYQIVKNLKNKFPLGIVLICSDAPKEPWNEKFPWKNKANKIYLKVIQQIIERGKNEKINN